ncbi:hypothetical protein K525DRAFT_234150 [Schizophyllum commune Loenen D]|nr:hypothetical protein K525DRAFT_234150 [Schizophyllum commune Loenen D]
MLGRLPLRRVAPLKRAASTLVANATSPSRRIAVPSGRICCCCRTFYSSPRRWSEQKLPVDADKKKDDGKEESSSAEQTSRSEESARSQENAETKENTEKSESGGAPPPGQGPDPKQVPTVVIINVRKAARFWLFSALGVGALGFAYYFNHLDKVPETGRIRFINVRPETEEKLAKVMRDTAYAQFKNKILPADHPLAAQIRGIVSRILDANQLGRLRDQPLSDGVPLDDWSGSTGNSTRNKDGELWNPDLVEADPYAATTSAPSSDKAPGEWDVIVVNDKRFVNAYADIGLVVIGTGFLPICQNEQGLAAVLSHEIAHVVARHRAENMSTSSLYWGVGAYTIAFFGLIGLLASLVPWGLGVFSEIPHSIGQEFEADIIGLKLMAKACYDPRASPEMLKRLAKIEEDVQKKLHRHDHVQTHPLAMERAKMLEPLLGKGYETMATNPDCADALSKFHEAAATLRSN